MKATLTTVTRTSHWLWESHAYYLVVPTIPGAIHSEPSGSVWSTRSFGIRCRTSESCAVSCG